MAKAKKVKQKIMLDLGCGRNKNAGFVGMDKRDIDGVDIVHDVESFPWPLNDESCAVITASHLVEHVKPWLQIEFIDECWRVLEVGGILMIATPYATSFGYSQDPTHCAPWNEATPDYFIPGTVLYEVYQPQPWEKARLYWDTKATLECALRKIERGSGNGD